MSIHPLRQSVSNDKHNFIFAPNVIRVVDFSLKTKLVAKIKTKKIKINSQGIEFMRHKSATNDIDRSCTISHQLRMLLVNIHRLLNGHLSLS